MTTKEKIKILKIVSKFNKRNMPHGTGADVDFNRSGSATVYVWKGEDIIYSLSSYNLDTDGEFVDSVKFNLK